MFERVTLRGGAGEIVWGYRSAAVVDEWAIRKEMDPKSKRSHWAFIGKAKGIEPFILKQPGLVFAAKRKQGFWCWPVLSVTYAGTRIQGKLGPPQQ